MLNADVWVKDGARNKGTAYWSRVRWVKCGCPPHRHPSTSADSNIGLLPSSTIDH